MIVLVIPCCRKAQFDVFIEKWENFSNAEVDKIIVVWDLPNTPNEFRNQTNEHLFQHYNHSSIPDYFSKRDSAIRSFGFLKAWQMGATEIITLDDDCFPEGNNPIKEHVAILESGINSRFSTIKPLHTRGLPYNPGCNKSISLNMGLWTNVPDLDALNQVTNGIPLTYNLPIGTNLLHPDQWIPMCGMNLSFNRIITPLMYFALMGEGTPYSRFDDIWCGLIVFKVMKHLGLNIAYGEPYVHHSRASDKYVNLLKEAPGIEPNEKLWDFIQYLTLKETCVVSCFEEIITHLEEFKGWPREYKEHYIFNAKCWIRNFKS